MALTTATTGAHCSGDVRTPARWGLACASSLHLVLPSSSQRMSSIELQPPEILDHVFSIVDRSSVLTSALVCRNWRDSAQRALSHIWPSTDNDGRECPTIRAPLDGTHSPQMRMTKGTKPGRSGSSLRSTASRGAGDRAGATCQPALPSSPNKPTRGTQTRGATAGGEGVKRRGGGAYTRRGDWDVREKLSSFDEERGKGRTGDQRSEAGWSEVGASASAFRGQGARCKAGARVVRGWGERLNCALP